MENVFGGGIIFFFTWTAVIPYKRHISIIFLIDFLDHERKEDCKTHHLSQKAWV